MSKEHYVHMMVNAINTGNLYKIKDVENNINHSRENLREVLSGLDSDSRSRYDQIVNRDQYFQNQIKTLQGDLQNQARNYEKNINQLTSSFKSQIQEQSQQFNRQITRLENIQQSQRKEYIALTDQLNQSIQNERNERIRDVKHLQGQINNINATMEQRRKMAEDLLAGVDMLISEISKMPHDRFTPGKLAKLQGSVETVRASVNTMPEGVWGTLTSVWNELWDLKADISVKEIEFLTKYDQALSACLELLAQAQENASRILSFNSADDTKQDKEIDIDFWSNGDLGKYTQTIQTILKELKDNETNPFFGISQMDAILERIAKEGPELADIIIRAGNNVAASEIRFDIAEIGANVLANQLFNDNSIKSVYEGSDQRAGYVLQMENENGTKATLIVSPSDDIKQTGAFKLTINFENDDDNLEEEDIKQRSLEIENQILTEAGMTFNAQKIGDSVCHHTPDCSFSNIEEVKRRKLDELKTIKLEKGK